MARTDPTGGHVARRVRDASGGGPARRYRRARRPAIAQLAGTGASRRWRGGCWTSSRAAPGEVARRGRALGDGAPGHPRDAARAGGRHRGPEPTGTAGLVLVAPYLPMLFDRLAITSGGRLPDSDAAGRAMDVLHAIAHGDAEAPRGRAPGAAALRRPARPAAPPGPAARAAGGRDWWRTSCARSSRAGRRWAAPRSTGLREAFLRREGLLRRTRERRRARGDAPRLRHAARPAALEHRRDQARLDARSRSMSIGENRLESSRQGCILTAVLRLQMHGGLPCRSTARSMR